MADDSKKKEEEPVGCLWFVGFITTVLIISAGAYFFTVAPVASHGGSHSFWSVSIAPNK